MSSFMTGKDVADVVVGASKSRKHDLANSVDTYIYKIRQYLMMSIELTYTYWNTMSKLDLL